jgi:hypothetical protein
MLRQCTNLITAIVESVN